MKNAAWNRIARAAAVAALALSTVTGSAWAAPRAGEAVAAARAESLDGKAFDTRSVKGQTVLVFYEDKDTANQNAAFKNELGRLRKATGFKPGVRVVAVADVSSYDFWPAKGLVQDAIKKQQKASGVTIFLDWSGKFGTALKARKGVSNVVLIGPDGNVMVSHEGVVSADVASRIKAAVSR